MRHLTNLLLAACAIFAPIRMALITVLVLILADLVLGVWASVKSKQSITSSGLRRTVIKFFLYELAILLGFLAETFLIGASVPVCKLISAFIGLTELKSIMENLNAIGGGSLFAALLSKLNPNDTLKP
jgi:hypothetical protein